MKIQTSPWLIFALLICFATMQFFAQGSVGLIASVLADSLATDMKGLGILSSAFYFSFILLQIPGGLLLDSMGLRKVALSALFLLVVGCLCFASSSSLVTATVSRVLMGSGAGFAFICLLTGARLYFPPLMFPVLIGLGECFIMLGVSLSNNIFSQVSLFFNWRIGMLSVAVCGFVLFLLFYFFLRGPQAGIIASESGEGEVSSLLDIMVKKPLANLKKLMVLEIWLCGLFSGLCFTPITVFAAMWGVPFLKEVNQMPESEAVVAISMVYVGVALASPLLGYIARKGSFIKLMAIGSFSTFILSSITIYFPAMPKALLMFTMFALGAVCTIYQYNYAVISQKVTKEIQGAAMGLANMLTMLTAPLFQYIIGCQLDSNLENLIDSHRVDYQSALLLIPIGGLIAFVLTLFIHEGPSRPFRIKLLRPKKPKANA